MSPIAYPVPFSVRIAAPRHRVVGSPLGHPWAYMPSQANFVVPGTRVFGLNDAGTTAFAPELATVTQPPAKG